MEGCTKEGTGVLGCTEGVVFGVQRGALKWVEGCIEGL